MRAPLVLASRSPQRHGILGQLGIAFDVVVPEVEELGDGDPRELVVENALRKARAVDAEQVLGVDTEVVLGERVYGKPRDEAEARAFLSELSGRTHSVWSGLALIEGGEERTAAAETRVRFRDLAEPDIRWYLGTGEWEERAGAYAIQGKGAALIEGIEGDYSNVVGLPISELIRLAPELLSTEHQATED